jgi:hypothetical protein
MGRPLNPKKQQLEARKRERRRRKELRRLAKRGAGQEPIATVHLAESSPATN